MSGLKELKTRIRYRSQDNSGSIEKRINTDKLRNLKHALWNSYQGATICLADGRLFRALMNPDKLSMDADYKIISIPFADICLNEPEKNKIQHFHEFDEDFQRRKKTSEGIVDIGLKPGDSFTWVQNNTHWLVGLPYKNETAYFRAKVFECKEQVEIGGNKYWCYIRGPIETSIQWLRDEKTYFNKLNYSLMMYIPSDEVTKKEIHRFAKLKVAGAPWEVQTVDSISTPGIIEVYLKETNSNSIKDEEEEKNNKLEEIIRLPRVHIKGDNFIAPYDIKQYEIVGAEGGSWRFVDTKDAKLTVENDIASIEVLTGKSKITQDGITKVKEFLLEYVNNDKVLASLTIKMISL